MKLKLIAAIAAALFAGGVQAATGAISTSQGSVGSMSVTGNVQNGIAVQGTRVGASNTSTATAIKLGPITFTSGSTNGATGSASAGFAFGAFGATGGYATQTGSFGAISF